MKFVVYKDPWHGPNKYEVRTDGDVTVEKCSSQEEAARLAYTLNEAEAAAREYKGFCDLLRMYFDAEDDDDRAAIIADIDELLEEIKQPVSVLNMSFQRPNRTHVPVDKMRRLLTGMCHCGHPYDMHHNSGIEPGVAEECCAYRYAGNENGGLNTDGTVHCQHYIDTSLPDDLPRRLRN